MYFEKQLFNQIYINSNALHQNALLSHFPLTVRKEQTQQYNNEPLHEVLQKFSLSAKKQQIK